jgi:hypothetical protein
VEIVELIRRKEVEKAMTLIEKALPQLLEEEYVVAFLKAHVFLRIVREGTLRPT